MTDKELEKVCKEKTEDRPCYFLENTDQLRWVKNNDEKLMPHISQIYRVNYCPICGAYVRDVRIPLSKD